MTGIEIIDASIATNGLKIIVRTATGRVAIGRKIFKDTFCEGERGGRGGRRRHGCGRASTTTATKTGVLIRLASDEEHNDDGDDANSLKNWREQGGATRREFEPFDEIPTKEHSQTDGDFDDTIADVGNDR